MLLIRVYKYYLISFSREQHINNMYCNTFTIYRSWVASTNQISLHSHTSLLQYNLWVQVISSYYGIQIIVLARPCILLLGSIINQRPQLEWSYRLSSFGGGFTLYSMFSKNFCSQDRIRTCIPYHAKYRTELNSFGINRVFLLVRLPIPPPDYTTNIMFYFNINGILFSVGI